LKRANVNLPGALKVSVIGTSIISQLPSFWPRNWNIWIVKLLQ